MPLWWGSWFINIVRRKGGEESHHWAVCLGLLLSLCWLPGWQLDSHSDASSSTETVIKRSDMAVANVFIFWSHLCHSLEKNMLQWHKNVFFPSLFAKALNFWGFDVDWTIDICQRFRGKPWIWSMGFVFTQICNFGLATILNIAWLLLIIHCESPTHEKLFYSWKNIINV